LFGETNSSGQLGYGEKMEIKQGVELRQDSRNTPETDFEKSEFLYNVILVTRLKLAAHSLRDKKYD
jgi:hypothetical protein